MSRLARIAIVGKVSIADPPIVTKSLNLSSVSTMERRLKALMAIPKPQRPKTAYLEAWLHYTKQRAYPYDTVDWEAIQAGSGHRDAMPPASLHGKVPSANPKTHAEKSTMGDTFGPWEYIGPNNLDIPYRIYYGIRPLSGRVNAIAYDPSNTNTFYLAGATGGLWKTTDKGVTWTCLSDTWEKMPVGAIAIDPKNPQIIYCGKVDVAASKIDPATVYVLSCGDQKIFKSTNRGDSWTDITGSFPGGYNWSQSWYDYHITTGKGASADLVFVGLIDIVYSPDGGATWQTIGGPTYSTSAITHNDQHSLGINPNNENEVLVGNDGGIFLYTWNGSRWTSQGLNRSLGITQFYQADWHPSDPAWMLGGTQDNATPLAKGDLASWLNVGGGDGGFCAINPSDPNNQ